MDDTIHDGKRCMIKNIVRTLFLLVIILIALFAFLLTPFGLRTSIQIAEKLLPGQLSYSSISGVLVGPLTIDNLQYTHDQNHYFIKQIHLNWSPSDLLKKQIHINHIVITDMTIIQNGQSTPTKITEQVIEKKAHDWITKFTSSFFPMSIRIDEGRVGAMQIHTSQSTMQLQDTTFKIIFTHHDWNATLSTAMMAPIHLQARFALTGSPNQYQIQCDIVGKNTHFMMNGSGTQKILTLHTAQNSTLLNGTLSAQLSAQWNPRMTWSGALIAKNIDLSMLYPTLPRLTIITIHTTGNLNHAVNTNEQIDFQTRDNRTDFSIKYHHQLNVNWKTILHTDISFLGIQKGMLKSEGKIAGQLNNPHFAITTTLLSHPKFTETRKIKLIANGNLKKQSIAFILHYPRQHISIKLDGILSDRVWQGSLKEFTLSFPHNDQWRLNKTTSISITANSSAIEPFCLQSAAGTICFHANQNQNHVSGALSARINHFYFLQALSRDFTITRGQLISDIRFNGTIQQPHITGSINLNQGNIVIPKANITLTNLTTQLTSDGQHLLFNAQAYSKNQPIQLQGTVHLSGSDVVAQAKLTAKNALIMNTNQYQITASALLNAAMKNNLITISGNIHVPKANIVPNDFQTTTTLPDNDIVYTGISIKPPEPTWLIHTNVLVTLGNAIHLNVSGINAMLGGQVRITQEPKHDFFGTGSIVVHHGTYVVYGQKLTIQPNSSLSFENSLLNNPSLDLKASRVIRSADSMDVTNFSERELIVGIEMRGTIKMPKITFFSNRSNLSQSAILSYVLLGYGPSTNAPGNTDLLLRAISAVDITSQGLLGKQNIAYQIQSGLGLSEMGVESETSSDEVGNPLNNQSAFVVGKQLTKRLYARYSIGILDSVDVFEIRYLLSKNWAVQMDSSTLGNDTGGDILYTVEKN